MAADETNLTETPAETPADTSAASKTAADNGGQPEEKDNRSAEVQAVTSHLKNVRVPGEDDEDGDGEKSVEVEVKLPKTLKASHALLAEVQDFQPKTPAEAKKKATTITKLVDHIHQLGQGHKIETISGDDHAEFSERTTSHAEEIHLNDVCRHDKIVEKRILADAATIKALKAKIAELTKPNP